MAMAAGAFKHTGFGGEVNIAACGAQRVPVWFCEPLIFVSGPHVLSASLGNEVEHYAGRIGQNLLGGLVVHIIDLRAMRFSVQP